MGKGKKVNGKDGNDKPNFNSSFLSKRHNEIVALTAIGTLLVTTALSTITYFSLQEVKKQRDLTYKQFVMANRPNITIVPAGNGMKLEEKVGSIEWNISLKGGDIKDVKYQVILFHINGKSVSDYSVKALYVRNIRQEYLAGGTVKIGHNPILDSTLKTTKEILG